MTETLFELFALYGVPVVFAVMCRPPERAPLSRHCAQEGREELHRPGRAECAVREVSMIEGGDHKHPHPVQCECDADGCPAPSRPDHAETDQVNADDRQRIPDPDSLVVETHPVKVVPLPCSTWVNCVIQSPVFRDLPACYDRLRMG